MWFDPLLLLQLLKLLVLLLLLGRISLLPAIVDRAAVEPSGRVAPAPIGESGAAPGGGVVVVQG